jgi:adenosylmethionine-8-amino-7-oxononanoate aminotransferase
VCGTVIAFEVKDTVEGYTSSVRDRITAKALEMGVYLRPLGNTVYVMPPYCINEEELEMIYSVVLAVIPNPKTV